VPPSRAPRADAPCTASVEDYLKAILELSNTTTGVSTSEIARRLQVAPPSVTGMVHHLAEQGLLDYLPYHGVRLRPSGERIALRVLRRHAVIESYLVRVLHCPTSAAAAEAERLEHAVTEELADRMAAALDEPTVAPDGFASPARAGTDGRTV